MNSRLLFISVGALLLANCGRVSLPSDSVATPDSSACMQTGDIIVSNSGADVVLVLSPEGVYKNVAFNVVNSAETVYGLAWSAETNELLVAVDGADRVQAVKASDCSSRTLVSDVNLTGNIRGLAHLASGDILVVESNNVERFTFGGYRVTAGAWPKALQTTGSDINALASGGFVHCSTGTDVVRTYTDAGVQISTVASGIPATTDVSGCIGLRNGNIAAVFSGTTDTVRIYNSTLSTVVASYSDLGVLATPGGVAERANGNLLVIDRVLNYLVELSPSGAFVNVVGDSVLSTPEHIYVVP